MKRTIFKFMHYCLSFLNFKPYFGALQCMELSYNVSFDKSCIYDIGSDQSDINKLFGISYGFHHKQSDRIGWRYVGEERGHHLIELLLYSYYDGGEVKKLPITTIRIGDTVKVTLKLSDMWGCRYIDAIVGNTKITTSILHTRKNWGYTLGLYFGGNKRAPHTMSVRIEKIKEWLLKVA